MCAVFKGKPFYCLYKDDVPAYIERFVPIVLDIEEES
jgi:hypothetical protein